MGSKASKQMKNEKPRKSTQKQEVGGAESGCETDDLSKELQQSQANLEKLAIIDDDYFSPDLDNDLSGHSLQEEDDEILLNDEELAEVENELKNLELEIGDIEEDDLGLDEEGVEHDAKEALEEGIEGEDGDSDEKQAVSAAAS